MVDRLPPSRVPAYDKISQAVLAIGKPYFPKTLLDTLRQSAGVGHCMVFSFDGEQSARCRLDIGNIPIGSDLGAAYSGHFHLADPNRDTILERRTDSSPILLPLFARRMYNNRYRQLFFDNSAIVDKFAVAMWVDQTCFYLNFYRTVSQGRFNAEQLRYLTKSAPILVAAVANHLCKEDHGPLDPSDVLETAFSTSEPFVRLTKREREVCLRILGGYTSEGISSELGVSLQSTLTYRKRAYDKLGISSQSELFKLAIRSLVGQPRLN